MVCMRYCVPANCSRTVWKVCRVSATIYKKQRVEGYIFISIFYGIIHEGFDQGHAVLKVLCMIFNFRSITRCVDYLSTHEVAHNIFFSRAQPLRTSGAVQSEDKTNALPQLVTAYIFPRIAVVGTFSHCLQLYSSAFFHIPIFQTTACFFCLFFLRFLEVYKSRER